jgi:hypothetical protein
MLVISKSISKNIGNDGIIHLNIKDDGKENAN